MTAFQYHRPAEIGFALIGDRLTHSTNQLVDGSDVTERAGRRNEIVQAAFRQVATVGFEGLRLRQIAEDVGIDHSTLHHHFPGKKDIVSAIAEYAIGQFDVPPPETASPAEALNWHLTHLRRVLGDSPDLLVVTAELDLRARRDPAVREVMDEHEKNWRRFLDDMLTAGVERRMWSARVNVPGTIELVIATVKGIQLAPDSADAAIDQLTSLLMNHEVDA